MKSFLAFIGKLIVILIFTAIALDIMYTLVYHRSNSRNKIDYLYNSKNQNYDVVFLGSSRVNNHFVPKIFNDQGLKTYNFGLTRSRLEESALMLKLMVERHYKHIPVYNQLLYIPFYRYMHYDARIGFREFYQSAIRKKTNQLDNDGFYPLLKNQRPMVPADLSKYTPKRNVAYEEIKLICQKHNIKLIAMATPMCMSTINREYFKQLQSVYPEILNFEDAVTNDKYFSTCGHLNKEGAEEFTRFVFNRLFKSQSTP
jgi:hypothetical protein